MSEEKIYEGVEYEGVEVEETVVEEAVVTEPVVAKKGLAKASLVLGILAFITTLLVVNYVFGILALIFGIIYLTKKDRKLVAVCSKTDFDRNAQDFLPKKRFFLTLEARKVLDKSAVLWYTIPAIFKSVQRCR